MDNEYKYSGQRLRMKIARELIIEFFEGSTLHKKDMIRKVDEVHLERGGELSKNIVHPVTDALNALKRKGLSNNPNSGDGIWTIIGETPDERIDDGDDSTDEARRIGSGNNSVYVYYYPNYKQCAELQGKDTWPCKIGRSEYQNPIHRIYEQQGTGMPEKPEIALIMLTNQPKKMESAIHNLLYRITDAPGTEWFRTNPDRVEEIYNIIIKDYS